jgi:hypothetical protein
MVAIERELTPTAPAPSADAIPLRLRRGGGTPRQVFALVLIGTLILAVFASRDLTTWLNGLGDGPVLAPLQRATAGWEGATAKLGLTAPADALREAIRQLLDWQWPGRP